MRNLILILIAGLVLAGCATEAEFRAAQEKKREAQFLSFQKECEAYGAVKGTDTYVECMLTVSKRAIDEKNLQTQRQIQANRGQEANRLEKQKLNNQRNHNLGHHSGTGSKYDFFQIR